MDWSNLPKPIYGSRKGNTYKDWVSNWTGYLVSKVWTWIGFFHPGLLGKRSMLCGHVGLCDYFISNIFLNYTKMVITMLWIYLSLFHPTILFYVNTWKAKSQQPHFTCGLRWQHFLTFYVWVQNNQTIFCILCHSSDM